jgi:hypothetical protein
MVILSSHRRVSPLFAVILRDWSGSLGVAPVGMSRVLWAEAGAHSAIVLAVFAAAFAFWIPLRGRPRLRALRLTVGGMATALILWPRWAAMQDNLFLFSVLPSLWPWLAAASGLAGLSLAAVALTPERVR